MVLHPDQICIINREQCDEGDEQQVATGAGRKRPAAKGRGQKGHGTGNCSSPSVGLRLRADPLRLRSVLTPWGFLGLCMPSYGWQGRLTGEPDGLLFGE